MKTCSDCKYLKRVDHHYRRTYHLCDNIESPQYDKRRTLKNIVCDLIKNTMKTGIELIAEERKEQIEKHGRTIKKDVQFNDSEQLSMAAEMLLAVSHEEGIDPASYPDGWDYDICQKMISKPYKQRLIIAGALIAAEIDRLQSLKS